MIACQETACECPCDLGTPKTLVATHRHFDNTMPLLCSFDHHFHRPTIGLVFHPKGLERGLSNGAKRPNIRQGYSIEHPHQAGDHAVPHALLRRQATVIVLSLRPRAQDEVSLIVQKGVQYPRQFSRVVTPIPIKKDQNIGVTCGACTGQAGRAIPPAWFLNHGGPSGLCHCGGAVVATVINDNDLLDQLAGDGPDHTTNSGFFIQSWDNRHNAHGASSQSASARPACSSHVCTRYTPTTCNSFLSTFSAAKYSCATSVA